MGDRVLITTHTDAEMNTFNDAAYRSRVKDLRILALPLSEGCPPVKANISGTLHLLPQPHRTAQTTLSCSTKIQSTKTPDSPSRSLRANTTGNKSTLTKKRFTRSTRTKSSNALPTLHTGTAVLDHLLAAIPALHTKLARYDAVDAAAYYQFECDTIPNALPIHPHEDALVDKSVTYDDQWADYSDLSANDLVNLSEEEMNALIVSRAGDKNWKRIPNTVTKSVSYFRKIESDSSAWGKATATVDASAAGVFAARWCQSSYANSKSHTDLGEKAGYVCCCLRAGVPPPPSNTRFARLCVEGANSLRRVAFEPHSRSMLLVFLVRLSSSLVSDRVFATWLTWREEKDKSIVIAFAPLEEYVDKAVDAVAIADYVAEQEKRRALDGTSESSLTFQNDAKALAAMIERRRSRSDRVKELNDLIKQDPFAAKAERGSAKGFWRFKPLAPSVCQITYVAQVRVGGSIPKRLLNLRMKESLKLVHTIQDQFLRKGKEVDAEMRGAFKDPPTFARLSEEQAAIVESCRSLGSDEGGEWQPLTSPSPFVDMSIKHVLAEKGKRSIALGMATAIIDCSALQAAAHMSAFMSRESVRINSENGHPARLILKENTMHDCVVATVKRLPFPLNNREFVSRQVCAEDDNGDLVLAFSPVQAEVDYGKRFKTVRGASAAFFTISSLGGSQCSATICQRIDAAGRIPTFVTNTKIALGLSVVEELRSEFSRDDEIDMVERDELVRVMNEEPQIYTQEENLLVNKANVKLGMLDWAQFEELESPDHLVKMGKIFLEGGGGGFGRASMTVDTSVEDCAAWEMSKMSREQVALAGSLERSLTRINDHSTIYQVVYDFGIPGFRPREFLSSLVWRRQGDKLTLVYDDIDHEDFPRRPHYVRGTTTVYWEFEKLQPVGGVAQTIVTYIQQVDLGGRVPKFVVNSQAVNQLMYLSTTRKRFDKSLEIDREIREQNIDMIVDHSDSARRAMGERPIVYSEEETKIIEEGAEYFSLFSGENSKSLMMTSPLAKGKLAYKSDRHAWGWATTTVRADPKEVLAFLWDTTRRSAQREDDLEKSVDERINVHNMLVYNKKRTTKIIADRDFLGRCVWKRTSEGYILVTRPEESERRPLSEDIVRGKYPSAMKITEKTATETTIEYVIHPDSGGSIPSFVVNRWMSKSLRKVTEIQEFFQALRGLEEWGADVGRSVGEVMCIKIKAEENHKKRESKVGARVRELFKNIVGLREIAAKYEFFQPMITRVVENRLGGTGAVESKLCNVSVKEGRSIGGSLALTMATNLTAEAGVDEWILKHQCLGELDRTEAWFR